MPLDAFRVRGNARGRGKSDVFLFFLLRFRGADLLRVDPRSLSIANDAAAEGSVDFFKGAISDVGEPCGPSELSGIHSSHSFNVIHPLS